MKKTIVFLIALFIVWIPVHLMASPEQESEEDPVILEQIKSQEQTDRLKALLQVKTFRRELIRGLIEIVEASEERWADHSSPRGVACQVLGELRAEEAVDVLVSILHIEGPNDEGGQTAAFRALVKIGIAAVPKLIEHIKISENTRSRNLAVGVLKEILGCKVGEFVLENELKEEKDPPAQLRVNQALAQLRKQEP